MKICTYCDETKQESEFGKKSNSRDGLKFRCKKCESIQSSIYYQNNKNKVKEYQETNKIRLAIIKKHWAENNPDKVKQVMEDYHQRNPDHAWAMGKRAFCSWVIKPLIMMRDKNICQLCNKEKGKIVHHIIPVLEDANDERIDDPKNLITLCKECHLIAHGGNYRKIDKALQNKFLEMIGIIELQCPTIVPIMIDLPIPAVTPIPPELLIPITIKMFP